MNNDLRDEIHNLILLGVEGDYWDYKEQWHNNNLDLLHDIICMANNLVNRDAYIIIGIDDSGKILGVPKEKRKNQQNVIDLIKNQQFAGDSRPTVYVKTIELKENEIDVIIIKNTNRTPYYLTKDYPCGQRRIYKGCIYTRIGDTNTSKESTADTDKTEYLWRKRFGLDLAPLEKIKFLLKNTKDWFPVGTDGEHSCSDSNGSYYNKYNPEFTIQYKCVDNIFVQGQVDKVEMSMYWLNKLPSPLHNVYIYKLDINFHSTKMYSTHIVFADTFRFKRIYWKNRILFHNDNDTCILYCYIEKDSLDFLLDEWLCNHSDTIEQIQNYDFVSSLNPTTDYKNVYSVVPVFEDAEEHKNFIDYLKLHKDDFLTSTGDYNIHDSKRKNEFIPAVYPDYIDYLCKTGKTITDYLSKWRENNAFIK